MDLGTQGEEGETTNDLFGFLTTEPNAEVSNVHPKAMPVILTAPREIQCWMTAPADEALKLQPQLPDGTLRIVAIARGRISAMKRPARADMPSGYEKSGHSSGPPPGLWSYIATAVAAGVIIAILFGCVFF
jgi:hypothetical protein